MLWKFLSAREYKAAKSVPKSTLLACRGPPLRLSQVERHSIMLNLALMHAALVIATMTYLCPRVYFSRPANTAGISAVKQARKRLGARHRVNAGGTQFALL